MRDAIAAPLVWLVEGACVVAERQQARRHRDRLARGSQWPWVRATWRAQ